MSATLQIRRQSNNTGAFHLDFTGTLAEFAELFPGRTVVVGVTVDPQTKTPIIHGGNRMGPIALKDNQRAKVALVSPAVDQGGNELLNADGTPFVPTLTITSDDVSIASVTDNGDGSWYIGTGKVGATTVHLTFTNPDVSTNTLDVPVAVGFSNLNDAAFAVTVEDEPVAAAPPAVGP